MPAPSTARGWFVLLLAGCADPATDRDLRQAWVVETLADDNRVWLSREPELLEAKYARMAADPYDFLRGSAALSFADWSRAGSDRTPSDLPGSVEAATVLLVGDPHPENVGTYLPGASPEPVDLDPPIHVDLEFTDFDGAGYGPWTLDVRRAAQSLALLAGLGPCDEACAFAVVARFAETYADEIAARAAGGPGWTSALSGDEPGPSGALAREAVAEGLGRARLLAWTRPTGDGRRFAFTPGLPIDAEGNRPLTPDEEAQLDRLLAAWPGARDRRVEHAARRLGMGVASVPAIRYVVLLDGGAPGFEDDALVMLREVVDPPALPGLRRDTRMLWDDNGSRVVDAARRLWSRPDADPWMAAVADGDTTFKVVTGSSFQEGFDHLDLLEDSWLAADPGFGALAESLGRLLASAHARGGTFGGGSAVDAIAQDLRASAFTELVPAVALDDAARLRTDHALFVDALDTLGPLLAADREVPTW